MENQRKPTVTSMGVREDDRSVYEQCNIERGEVVRTINNLEC